MRFALAAVLALQAAVPGGGGSDPFAFFSPTVAVRTADRRSLDQGTPMASVVESDGHDVAVFSVIPVDRAVDGNRVVGWMHAIAELKKSKYVLALKRFSSPPRIEDLDTLTLDESDLGEIRRCRAGKCGLKLTAAEISELQRAVAGAGANWRPAVQSAFRQIVLQRIMAYTQKGHSGLAAYSDRAHASSLDVTFQGLIGRSPFLSARVPQFAEYLTRYPSAAPRDVESFIYWSKEKLGNKPVVSATHVIIRRGDGLGAPEVLVAGKQIFATHYMDGSLGLTALVRDSATGKRYLAYLNRSNLDVLGGFWGGLVRMVLERRLKSEAPAVLKQLHERLSSGPPPGPGGAEQPITNSWRPPQ